MTDTTIALGADHAGFRLKDVIAQHLADRGVQVLDLGTNSDESVDYPDYGAAVGRAVAGLATSTRPVSFVRPLSCASLLALALLALSACGGGGAV